MGLLHFIHKTKNKKNNIDKNRTVILNLEDFGFPANIAYNASHSFFEDIDTMDGPEFEEFCADLLRRIGFVNVQVSGKSGDQGVDILANKDGIKYAIQCKCYSSDLGNTPVQEVYAGKNFYNCHVGAVMTNRFFTVGGQQLADSTGILLWDRNWIKEKAELCGMVEEDFFKRITYTDDLFVAAVSLVLESRQADPQFISKSFNIGFARAARLIDEMENNRIIGEFRGSKPRHILISKEQWARYIKK